MSAPRKEPPKRPDLYVVARFLDRLHALPEGQTHARLQAAVRLNYDLYRAYLALLCGRGYVEVRLGKDEVERAHLTAEGAAARAALVGWIRDAFGEIKL